MRRRAACRLIASACARRNVSTGRQTRSIEAAPLTSSSAPMWSLRSASWSHSCAASMPCPGAPRRCGYACRCGVVSFWPFWPLFGLLLAQFGYACRCGRCVSLGRPPSVPTLPPLAPAHTRPASPFAWHGQPRFRPPLATTLPPLTPPLHSHPHSASPTRRHSPLPPPASRTPRRHPAHNPRNRLVDRSRVTAQRRDVRRSGGSGFWTTRGGRASSASKNEACV